MGNVEKARRVMEEVKKVIVGKDECVEKIMTGILAQGHILIEDIPGVGKTTFALAFAKAMNLKQNRVQFTPDVLPTDITGFSTYNKRTESFVYQPGAAMCNLLLADEINRTSPKTQSALLEVMEEGNVTVDGVTREVPTPFIVIATENPIGSAGTQMLPESQLDRFIICISMGYPDMQDEINIIKDRREENPLDNVVPAIMAEDLVMMQKEVSDIFVHDEVYKYIVRLVTATRKSEMLDLGISPRGTLALSKMVQARAYLQKRDYVIPEDVASVFSDVAVHRIRRSAKAKLNHKSEVDVLSQILKDTPKPSPEKG
ncbi:MAG: MoxR family ATPase [Lachnospiraceae bacterium]|nr:MoxR family ATPase [Lachnospiraceae bacterium]MDE6186220.1 MoxR family ATPase [Lachnospiraceae bacterium]MDE7286864.1 MoxR family ATPase [Lachnospiraceae bacterium]